MCTWMFVVLLATGQFAQSNTGEMRVTVFDPSGLGAQSQVELASEANQFREHIETDAQGALTVKRLSVGFSYQHIFSTQVLGDVRGMVRDVTSGLWSNTAATPSAAQQDRGFRELYVKST